MNEIINKKLSKVFLIILIGCVIAYIVYNIVAFITLVSLLNGNYSEEKMNYYKSKENREKYFNEHKDSFNNIANILEQYSDIESIKEKNGLDFCLSDEIEVVNTEKVTFCVKEKSKQIQEIKKLKVKSDINDLKEIVKIKKRQSDDDIDAAITFYIISSVNNDIQYNYCLSKEECDSEDNYHKEKYNTYNGEFIKNKIDDKWSSIYDNLKKM